MLAETLQAIRNEKTSFKEGLTKAEKFIQDNKGVVVEMGGSDGNIYYELVLGEESATAFQPYPDIDSFYFES